MKKPTTKQELLDSSKKGFELLMATIENLPASERVKEWKTKERDKNLNDVIYHLHAWHKLLLHWLSILKEGGKPAIPKEGYTWDDIDVLNHELWLDAQKHTLMDTLELFKITYQACAKEVQSLTEDQIFKSFSPSFNHPIIGLLDGCMAEHYAWAMEILKERYTQII
jgi:hypothetical protein